MIFTCKALVTYPRQQLKMAVFHWTLGLSWTFEPIPANKFPVKGYNGNHVAMSLESPWKSMCCNLNQSQVYYQVGFSLEPPYDPIVIRCRWTSRRANTCWKQGWCSINDPCGCSKIHHIWSAAHIHKMTSVRAHKMLPLAALWNSSRPRGLLCDLPLVPEFLSAALEAQDGWAGIRCIATIKTNMCILFIPILVAFNFSIPFQGC
jgi:hypothetical protein